MAIELHNDGKHVCLMFNDPVDDTGSDAVQANQFLSSRMAGVRCSTRPAT